jgi:hypothetical protein
MPTSESALQKLCIKSLIDKKIYHINIHNSGWAARGAPDLIVCIHGKFVAFELKVGANRLENAQIINAKRIIENGGLHFVVRSLDEFTSILESLTDGK